MGGRCLLHFIIYKATCRKRGKCYIGSSQCHFKKRMNGHFTDVGKLVEKGITSDSFARHFSQFFTEKPNAAQLREIIDF